MKSLSNIKQLKLIASIPAAISAAIICISLTGISGTAIADAHAGSDRDGKNRAQHISPQERASRLADKLDLTDSQRESAREIFEEHREQMSELRSNTRDEVKDQRLAIKENTRSELADVLTADQLAQLDEMRAARKAEKIEKLQKRLDRLNEEGN